MKMCTVPDCEKKSASYGLCTTHAYRRDHDIDLSLPVKKSLTNVTTRERLYSMITIVDDDSSCWLWNRPATDRGYSQFVTCPEFPHPLTGRTDRPAYVIAWVLENGEVPIDHTTGKLLHVRHLCHNKLCCRPDHLAIGTAKDNKHDDMRNGRVSRGVDHYRAKLNEDQVRDVRARYSRGESIRSIARAYGMAQFSIHGVATGKSYKDVI